MLNRLRRDERGAVMYIAAASFTVLLLFAGLALDFGRAYLLKAQLQTAVDSGSLAGALQVIPYATIAVDRWVANENCTDPVTGKPYRCLNWDQVGAATVYGPKWPLLNGGWRAAMGSQCDYPYRCSGTPWVVSEKLILPGNTSAVAQDAFGRNSKWPPGTRIYDVSVSINPEKAEVTTRATLSFPTTFLKLIGIRELRFTRTGTAKPVPR